MSGKNFSAIVLRSTILYFKLFMFKKPVRGWLWSCALNPKRISNIFERSDSEERVGPGKGVRSSTDIAFVTDICDSEKPVETVFVDEQIPRDPEDTVLYSKDSVYVSFASHLRIAKI